jgi:hypothetical protein
MPQTNLYTQECESVSDNFSEDIKRTKKKIHQCHSENLVSTPSRSKPKYCFVQKFIFHSFFL